MLQCDFAEQCRPCVRAQLKCSGPRDPSQLSFRDESRATVEKVLAQRAAKLHRINIITPIEERAKGFFWSHYVCGKSSTFDYIQSVLNLKESDCCLSVSLDSVSLAHFSRRAHSVKALQMARHKYTTALQLTNAALRSSESVTKDATFLAVLFLDLFEKITKSSPGPLEYSAHAKGAIALATLRGHEQFRDPIGLRMFTQLSASILTKCIQVDIPVPAGLLDLWRVARDYLDVSSPKLHFLEQLILFVQLRVAVQHGVLSRTEIILSAKRIDSSLLAIPTKVAPHWMHETIYNTYWSADVYGDQFYVYQDHRISTLWNNIRIARIFLNKMILEQYEEGLDSGLHASSFADTLEIRTTKDTIIALSEEICASVTQFTRSLKCLDYSSRASNPPGCISTALLSAIQKPLSSSNSGICLSTTVEKRDYASFEVLHCYSLLFPLYVTGHCEFCPERMRVWIINRLYFLDSTMHIKDAALVAGYLERRESITPWSIYAMIGSYSCTA